MKLSVSSGWPRAPESTGRDDDKDKMRMPERTPEPKRTTVMSNRPGPQGSSGLYTEEEKRRRDASPWTLVQGILAPLQFLVFLVSAALVWRYFATGEGAQAATASVVIKTFVLYAIMITGSIWERDVFGQFLFARPFFWEDVVSMLVLALHTAYLACVILSLLSVEQQLVLALFAYLAYVINAAQFLWKFRLARRQSTGSGQRLEAAVEL